MVDTLKVYEILKSGDVPDSHARAMTVAIQAAEAEINKDFKSLIHREFEIFGQRIEQKFELRLAETKTELIRWMFIFWASQLTATIGLVIAVLKLTR
jgi:hypothetical protein